ncbi:MAG TPA: ATPase domain-containing protein [archaeon]|nr:ATPase domain-containing protein [archaeon]
MTKENRVTTGVAGLDKLMEGGFVPGSINLISGKTGTGKTAFCTSFLYSGALKKEVGIYLTSEERIDDIKDDIKKMFGWDLDSLEKKGLIQFISLRPEIPRKTMREDQMAELTKLYVYDMMSKIESAVKKTNACRLVIDSISIIEAFIRDSYIRKIALMQILSRIKELKVTTLLSGSALESEECFAISGMTESLVDGVIKLEFSPIQEEFRRTFVIRKMRRTNHSLQIYPYEITKSGIKIIEIR